MTNWLHGLAIKPPLKDDKTFYCENYVDIDALLPYVCDNIGDIYPEGGWGPTDSNTVNFGLYVTMETGTTQRRSFGSCESELWRVVVFGGGWLKRRTRE